MNALSFVTHEPGISASDLPHTAQIAPEKQPDHPHSVHIGSLAVPSRFFLAPLAGYTNLALRRTVRELGGLGLATTDLVNARALLQGSPRTKEPIATAPDDRPLAVQIYGSEPGPMRDAAQMLAGLGI